MQVQTVKSLLSVVASVAAVASLIAFVEPAHAQSASQQSSRAGGSKEKESAPPQGLDQQTAKVLGEAIAMLNENNNAGAVAKIGTLNMEKLSPYERSKVE